jgi:hypothetical protein
MCAFLHAAIACAVKLAAANPLMALVSDVSSLLRLVDTAAGRTLTVMTRDPAVAARAAAAAAALQQQGAGDGAASSSGARVAPALAAMAAAAPRVAPCSAILRKRAACKAPPRFAESLGGYGWHTVQVAVAPQLLPVYVLGQGLSAAAVQRGLSSFVSSSALKLLAKSPAALATALGSGARASVAGCVRGAGHHAAAGQQQELPRAASAAGSGGDSESSSETELLLGFSGSSLSAHDTDRLLAASSGTGSGGGDSSRAAADTLVSAARARIRASLQLTPEQQAALTAHIHMRLGTLQQRCRIFSLCSN